MTTRHTSLLAACLLAASLAACGGGQNKDDTVSADTAATSSARAAAPARATSAKPAAAPVVQRELGTVTAIEPLYASKPTTGAGAILGTVVGAAVGHQFGGGDGKKLATAVGAVGGAVAGNKIEKDRNTQLTGYRVSVRHDDGHVSSHTLAQLGMLSEGQRVRVQNGQVVPA